MSIHVFGIRHHGPGCARSLLAALKKLKPDIVLVEGPPDAQEVIPFLAQTTMKPPLALLIYAPEQPQQAVYYPFTTFSPEWQALKYALKANISARFMDLPQAIQLAKRAGEEQPKVEPDTLIQEEEQISIDSMQSHAHAVSPADQEQAQEQSEQPELREDPLALLAQAAGYTDHELWWERQIEQRQNPANLFEGILEAMTALRSGTPPKDDEEAQREAFMRQTIRAAQAEGFQRIAVVCGAWHAPVLVDPGPEQQDSTILRGLKRIKVATTWIPWTNSRLSYKSGYGAGVSSPGWYAHLWQTKDHVTIRWIAKAAHLLRQHDLDASSANIVEAVRLSETLAAIRDLPQPGMAENNEAILTVLCNGDSAPMQLIREQLEIGEQLGQVSKDVPAVPLQHDLEQMQRRLRLKPSAEKTTLALDIRKETDRSRSQLLHRLHLLSIPWGKQVRVSGKAGTFHEDWQLQWNVRFALAVIEANIWGNTIETAAGAYICDTASKQDNLPELTQLLHGTILAELPTAIEQLLVEIQQRAAVSADVQHLMDALVPLARVARYSDVRQTKAERVLPVIDGLFERIVIGLPTACYSLDDDAARSMISSLDHVQESIQLLDRADQRRIWLQTLRLIAERESVHGLVRGRCCRLLLDQQALDDDEMQRLTNLSLSSAVPITQAAAWIEGVVQGSALLILHQENLWHALDSWLSTLNSDNFTELLPILRRAFSNFQAPERKHMGEKVKHLHRSVGASNSVEQTQLHQEHADLVLPLLAQLMGVSYGN